MKIKTTTQILSQSHSQAIVAFITEPEKDQPIKLKNNQALSTINQLSNGYFSKKDNAQHLPKKAQTIRTFYNMDGIDQPLIIIATENTQKGFSAATKSIVNHLKNNEINDATILFPEINFDGLSSQKIARLLAQNLSNTDYRFDDFKSNRKKPARMNIQLALNNEDKAIEKGITEGLSIAKGMKTLRDLGNMPGNVCTPKYLAETAKKMAEKYDSLSVDILKEKNLKELKMGSLLSVSKGSIEPPRLIKLHHKGSDDDPVIFVGKGVTFDTGGISLKPGANMDEMKYDMCGAGSVLGLMQTIAELNLPINIIGIVPAVENMPSDRASKPGDIVSSMSGKTIEILNTDAEGRLILCDALTYAQQFKPKAIVDMATLTGAVIIALGSKASGIMSNNDRLANALLTAGENSGDRAWRLPIWDEYTEQLKSPFADLQNIGGREAGTITAGCFLAEFIEDVPWAHIDIAGTAWQNRKEGATGRPVPLLAEYVFSLVGND